MVGRLTRLERSAKLKGAGAVAALLALAVLAGSASPGFPLGKVPAAVGRTVSKALHPGPRPKPKPAAEPAGPAGASRFALSDIPRAYLALYHAAAPTCPKLTWQVLAGIGKVESNHGRLAAPGVRSGLNSAGCCAGPMQFNLTNGPPSTWDAFGRGDVYDPADAIPAAARKLCANGLAKLDLRVQSILAVIAERYTIRISCLKTGHSTYVKGTRRVSNHNVWRAVDIDRVDGRPVSPSSRAAERLARWLDGLQGPLRPAEIGSPFPIGHEPYFSDEGHQEHLHIGYSQQQTAG